MQLTPFRTRPIYKDKVWAGGRLGKLAPGAPGGTGEVWLVSDVEGDASPIVDGPLAGKTLRDAVREWGADLLGPDVEPGRFPLLVKLLDIGPPLSVQVHPDADVARALGNGERGKCEAWLILGRGPDARVFLGVDGGTSADEVVALAREGGLAERLSAFTPAVGEGLEIVPGTLHTAREVVVLEVQETSDVTYRVFDWGRDRPLHLEQTRVCLERLGARPAPAREEPAGWRRGRRPVARHSPFTFDAFDLAPTERLPLETGVVQVAVLLEGSARLEAADVEPVRLVAGEALVVPAALEAPVLVAEAGGARCGYAAARAAH